MKLKILPNQYIRNMRQDLVNILDDFQVDDHDRNIMDHVIIDILVTTTDLLDVFHSHEESSSDLETNLSEKLAERWDRIQRGPLCYSRNNQLPMNTLCENLAAELSFCEDDKTKLLMPTVTLVNMLEKLSDYSSGQFMITDDGMNFIIIKDAVDSVFERAVNRDPQVFVYFDAANNRTVEMTQNEIQRLFLFAPFLQKSINEVHQLINKNPSSLRNELWKLRHGLKKGDASHAGSEEDAGAKANIAIAHFYHDVWSRFSAEQQQSLRAIHIEGRYYNFGEILDDLLKPEEAAKKQLMEVNLCVQIKGDMLSDLLNHSTTSSQFDIDTINGLDDDTKHSLKSLASVGLAKDIVSIKRHEDWSRIPNGEVFKNLMYLTACRRLKRKTDKTAPYDSSLEQDKFFIDLAVVVSEYVGFHVQNSSMLKKWLNFYVAVYREQMSFFERSETEKKLQLREIFLRCWSLKSSFSELLSNTFCYGESPNDSLKTFSQRHLRFIRENLMINISDDGKLVNKSSLIMTVSDRADDRIILAPHIGEEARLLAQMQHQNGLSK